MDQARPRRLRRWSAGLVLALVVAATVGGRYWYTSHHVHRKLLSAAVGLDTGGRLVNVPEGSPADVLINGSRVVHNSARAQSRAQEQRRWLRAGAVPGVSVPQFQPMVADALLDIDTLTLSSGASVASGPSIWRYVWPRDAAFSAVALSITGHQADAERILAWLQRIPAPDGVFQARYQPGGSGPPDERGIQTDGTGWVLWAIDATVQQAPLDRRATLLNELRPLIDRLTGAVLRLTSAPGALPGPSPDYWEVVDPRLSLGTAAPLALGLESASRIATARGLGSQATRLRARAATLRRSISTEFGRAGYPRYLGGQNLDAALTFLLPPFTAQVDPAVLQAWSRAQSGMSRPGGGLAPGTGWRDDGISWTPETALAALAAAATGDRAQAIARLAWLDAHRTELGALPEKVLSNGDPAGPAPLGWTAALVVLTARELDRQAS